MAPRARPPFYGLLAEFDGPAELVQAAHAVREQGYRRMDAFSPFPVEGLSEALGFQRTRMPLVMFLGGLQQCLAAADHTRLT